MLSYVKGFLIVCIPKIQNNKNRDKIKVIKKDRVVLCNKEDVLFKEDKTSENIRKANNFGGRVNGLDFRAFEAILKRIKKISQGEEVFRKPYEGDNVLFLRREDIQVAVICDEKAEICVYKDIREEDVDVIEVKIKRYEATDDT